MEDIKTTYTVAGKEFDTYEAAMSYKKELDSKDKNKQSLLDNIKKIYEDLLILVDEYQEKYNTKEDKEDLLRYLDMFDEDNTISIKLNTEALDKLEDEVKELLRVLGL